MGHARGHLAQTLNAAQTLSQGKDLGVLAEPISGFLAALDAETEHPASHAIAVLLQGDLAVGVGVEARVIDGDHERGRFQSLGDSRRVGGCLPRAQVEGLQPAMGKPAVESGRDGADSVLEEREALLEIVGVEGGNTHQDILIGPLVGNECAGSKNHTYRMSVDVLRNRMDHDIGAMIQRFLDIRAHKGVVDHDHNSMTVRDCRDLGDIHHPQGRVGRGLYPDQLGVVRSDQFLHIQLDTGRESHVYTVGGGNLGEIPVCPSIHIRNRHHMRALR